jgi:hypothetical protein
MQYFFYLHVLAQNHFLNQNIVFKRNKTNDIVFSPGIPCCTKLLYNLVLKELV